MQECEGCWVSTWYTALRPGEGLQSPLGCHNTAQLRQAGGSASSERSAENMIIKRTWTLSFRLRSDYLSTSWVCVCMYAFIYIYIYLYVRRTYQETQASGPCSLDTNRYHQPLRRVRRGHRRVPRFPWSDVPWSRSEVLTQLKTTSGTTTNIKSSLQLV